MTDNTDGGVVDDASEDPYPIPDGGVVIDADRDVTPVDELAEGELIRHTTTQGADRSVYSYHDGDAHVTVDDDSGERYIFESPPEIYRVVEEQHLLTVPENWDRVDLFDAPDAGGPSKQVYHIPKTGVWVLLQHPRPALGEFMHLVLKVGSSTTPTLTAEAEDSETTPQVSEPEEIEFDESELSADYYIRGLLGAGCTITRALDYYFVKIKGLTNKEWRNSERDASVDAVSSSISEAKVRLQLKADKISWA
jgi:hypothetical protein